MTNTTDLRFVVHVEESNFGSPLVRFTAHVVYVVDDGTYRNPLWDSYGEGRAIANLDAFEVSAQRDLQGDWYGFKIGYGQPYRVELDRAESMVKTLRKVQRSLDRQAETYGYAADLVSYVARVAQALKVSGYARRASESNSYTSGNWKYMDVDGLRWWLDDTVRTWQTRHGVTEDATS